MKLKITNIRKFTMSMIIILILVALIVFLCSKSIYSTSSIKYAEETIVSGDTLWSIAEEQAQKNEYYKNKDIRNIIQDIKNINELKTSSLENGQKIKIPMYM